jgi:hypothetical protein
MVLRKVNGQVTLKRIYVPFVTKVVLFFINCSCCDFSLYFGICLQEGTEMEGL